MDTAHPLDWERIAAARAAHVVGNTLCYEYSLPSTNIVARAMARSGARHGTAVVADEQTQGRGRQGRSWTAPPCSGIAVSILLRLSTRFALYTVPIVASLAVRDAIEVVIEPARCALKWPNDVLVDGKKAAGILVELDEAEDGWTAIVGVGVNVNAAPSLPQATSLATVAGHAVDREEILVTFLGRLEFYLDWAEREPEDVRRRWRDGLATLGRRVRVTQPDRVVDAVAEDVDTEGALIVRLDDGTRYSVRAGDVTLSAP